MDHNVSLVEAGSLLLQTTGAFDFDRTHLIEVFAEQRRRLIAVLEGFNADDWAAPTRCPDWDASHVVRHLCDYTEILIAAGAGDSTLDAGFDPRITPSQWLNASINEPPADTLTRIVASSENLLALLRDRLARADEFDVIMPWGPTSWTLLVYQGLWDSWIHERDIQLPRGIEQRADDDATRYVAAYGLFLAATVASAVGDELHHELTLGGNGGGLFDLNVEAHGPVTLTVTRVHTPGPDAAQVIDALAGRGHLAALLGDLPASSSAALSYFGSFMSSPLVQGQA